ncbi:Jasmonate O-methyltransferase [Sesamum angolense]|uniref:Jasmonate O-methyltransferase n=1 Tax=Sesamum angolense TaxID=2727404 RepID=A0AAE2BME4_9LAMI|nr:Jasmonate O-methyltransferase [Sesamum angolense]
MDEAVADALCKTLPAQTMGIADLGCSSGPNTLMVVSEMISKIYDECSQMGISLPELRVSLNDLPGNDFNYIFMSLPEFYRNLEKETGVGPDGCFISGVAGSFYGSESLPLTVSERFLRVSEIAGGGDVAGGRMLLSFMGRSSPDAAAEVGTHQWELLSQALMSMASEDLIQEEKIDSFNAPYYAPSAEEVANIVEEEGSFIINHLQGFEIDWDEGSTSSDYDNVVNGLENLSRGGPVAKTVRAVVETMLESHFGREMMDELFRWYAQLVDRYFSKTRAKHINLVLSVSRNTINSCY